MFANTREFSREAQHFLKHGYYCSAPIGTFAHKEYWDEQLRRLSEGYSVGGVSITGQHYGYLNFCQILLTTEIAEGLKGRRKVTDFPRFYDTDYDYFWELDKARANGKGMIVAKSRRKGFSYKNAWLVAHQFITIRKSINIVAAYLDDYADNTIGMVIDNLNFLNKHTAFKKQRNPDRRDFMKSQFKEVMSDGTEVWSGYQSEIHKLTFKDDPFKSIGKSCNLMLWEEAGKWPNLKQSYRFAEPTWMDGEYVVGMPIIFGTGGDMEVSAVDFADMFYHPGAYNLQAYDNIWDESATGQCGLFIPDYKSRPGFIDNEGNSLSIEAKDSEMHARRVIAETSKSTSDLDAYISQFPFTPKEAFKRRRGNIFPVELLQDHLSYIETHNEAKELGQPGRLIWEDGAVKWNIKGSNYPIEHYPTKDNENIEGSIVIWEHPEESGGSIPHGLYIAGLDPYDMDQAATSPSLGSIFIYKRMMSVDKTYHWPVAEYTGRPDTAEEYYENVRKLLTYYNAVCLYENEKKGIFQYFQTKYCTHLLKDQPEIIKDIIKNSVVNRGKGIHMVPAIKNYCEILLRDWLKEEYAPGKKNLTKIYSVPLLEELIAYNKDDGNFDRVISFMLCILYNLELYKIPEVSENKLLSFDSFFSRSLFTN
jgi:hypothetical protein